MEKKSYFMDGLPNIIKFNLLVILILLTTFSGCTSLSDDSGITGSTGNTTALESPITIVDSMNRSITFSKYPERIICANQGTVPLLILLGAGDRIVGVPSFVLSDPDLADKLPNAEVFAGSLTKVNCEQIIALNPDLIIEYNDYKPLCNDLIEESNVPILYFNSFDIPEMFNNSEQLGLLVGNEEKAKEYNNYISDYLAFIESRIANNSDSQKRIYFEYSTDYMTYGKGSKIENFMNILHAENIAQDIDIEYSTITPEWIIQQNPDIIIKSVSGSGIRANTTSLSDAYEDLINRPGYSNLTAVKNNQVYVINADLDKFTRQIIGVLYLAKIIYPDEFSDVDPDTILTEYAAQYQQGADKISTIYPIF